VGSSGSSKSSPRLAGKRVRIIKKVRVTGGVWKFVSLDKIRDRYIWDKRPGYYFLARISHGRIEKGCHFRHK